jgi:hypothetical protein
MGRALPPPPSSRDEVLSNGANIKLYSPNTKVIKDLEKIKMQGSEPVGLLSMQGQPKSYLVTSEANLLGIRQTRIFDAKAKKMVTFTQDPISSWLSLPPKREETTAELVPTKDKNGNLTGDDGFEVKETTS